MINAFLRSSDFIPEIYDLPVITPSSGGNSGRDFVKQRNLFTSSYPGEQLPTSLVSYKIQTIYLTTCEHSLSSV